MTAEDVPAIACGQIELPSEQASRVRRILLGVEGDAYDYEAAANGQHLELWHAGICVTHDAETGKTLFDAEGVYAVSLLEAAVRFATPGLSLDPQPSYRGRYVVFATGRGMPEGPRLIGPVDTRTLQDLEDPDLLEDLGLVLSPSTMFLPVVAGYEARPRVLAVLDDLGPMIADLRPHTLTELLAMQYEPKVRRAAEMLIEALVKADAAEEDIYQATSRLEAIRLRARVAQGLSAYFNR